MVNSGSHLEQSPAIQVEPVRDLGAEFRQSARQPVRKRRMIWRDIGHVATTALYGCAVTQDLRAPSPSSITPIKR
jgi:hypothetical protein